MESGDGYSSNKLDPSHYQDYANYLADFVDLMAAANVPLLGVSPANEPDYTATWDGAQWAPDELTKFVGQNLGPTFAKRCPSVKIITPDTASWPNVDSYVTPLLADSAAKSYLSIVATHPYQNGSAAIDLRYDKPQKNGKEFWETEWSQENMKGDTPDPTMTSAIDMAKHIHDDMATANMNAWSWWAIYISATDLQNGDAAKVRENPALIQPDKPAGDSNMFKRGYAFGNWSKFVRPGFQRIGATDKPTGSVLIEAYRDSTHLAIIAINAGPSTVTQKFILDGGSVTPSRPGLPPPTTLLRPEPDLRERRLHLRSAGPERGHVRELGRDQRNARPGEPSPGGHDAGADSSSKPSNGGLDCSNAVVPNNLVNGGVTDFTDWKGSSGKWGDPQGSLRRNLLVPRAQELEDERQCGHLGQESYTSRAPSRRVTTVAPGSAFSVCATVGIVLPNPVHLVGIIAGVRLEELQIKTSIGEPSGIRLRPEAASKTHPQAATIFQS